MREHAIAYEYMRPIIESDLNTLQSWLDYHKQVDVDLSCLPPTGIIEDGIAAFFYTMTNSKTMWIDTFITNPRAELAKRRLVSRAFAHIIYTIAKDNSIKRMFFLTRNKAVERVYAKLLNAQCKGEYKLYCTEYNCSD